MPQQVRRSSQPRNGSNGLTRLQPSARRRHRRRQHKRQKQRRRHTQAEAAEKKKQEAAAKAAAKAAEEAEDQRIKVLAQELKGKLVKIPAECFPDDECPAVCACT